MSKQSIMIDMTIISEDINNLVEKLKDFNKTHDMEELWDLANNDEEFIIHNKKLNKNFNSLREIIK